MVEKGNGLTFFIVWFGFSQRRRVAAKNLSKITKKEAERIQPLQILN